MAKEKIQLALYNKSEKEKIKVHYKDLDDDSYRSQYRDHLTCINGCKARIKFTQRKDNTKFYSTWNGEGNKHNEDCQYHVIYKGKIGRKKLKAYYENMIIEDDHIVKSLKNKIRRLRENYDDIDSPKDKLTTREIEDIGEDLVEVGVDGSKSSQSKSNAKNPYIRSVNALYLDNTYRGTRKCVLGYIRDIRLEIDNDGKKYAYINLKSGAYSVSACLADTFYSNEYLSDMDQFEKYITILKKEIESSKTEEKFILVCFGYIDKKKREKGLNVYINNPTHIFVNDMSFNKVLNIGKLQNVEYDLK
jgi:hypothetical protein